MVCLAAAPGGRLLLVDCLAGVPEDIPRCDVLVASLPLPLPIRIIRLCKETVSESRRKPALTTCGGAVSTFHRPHDSPRGPEQSPPFFAAPITTT